MFQLHKNEIFLWLKNLIFLSSTFFVFKVFPISFCTQFASISVLPTNYIILFYFFFFCHLFYLKFYLL
jgi:hypothetical protein